jgi:hypothetical protein
MKKVSIVILCIIALVAFAMWASPASADNTPPVADAGPDQAVLVGDTVTLDGSGSSDVDGDSLTFDWALISVPAGSGATLSDSTAVMPTFVADVAGTYTAQLIVNDGMVDSAPDTVAIIAEIIEPCNQASKTQGYWYRQCLGVPGSEGGLDPGRHGRGPKLPTEAGFVDELIPCTDQRLEDLEFFGVMTCEGIDADPPSDPCERATRQLTALILNVCSDRLTNSCEVDLSPWGCSSTDVGDLIEELTALINSVDPDNCKLAAECAALVNEGEGLVVDENNH